MPAVHPKTSHRRRAFTLIELLVVSGILAVMLGILLPALGKAHAAARSTLCKSNLRQMVIAFNAYASDQHGVMAPNSVSLPGGQTIWWFGWSDGAFPLLNRQLDPKRGLITSYFGASASANGMHCPEFSYEDANFVSEFAVHAADYGLNIFLSPYAYQKLTHKITSIKNPASTVVFADGVQMDGFPVNSFHEPFYLGIDMTTAGAPLLGPYGGFIQWRHQRTANVAYLDGHVDEVKQSDGYIVHPSVSGYAVGHLTSGDVGPASPYGNPK